MIIHVITFLTLTGNKSTDLYSWQAARLASLARTKDDTALKMHKVV